MNENFKLNLYFNMYKNSPIGSREKFRSKFIKKHGNFQYLPELIVMIEKYQNKRYGTTIWEEVYINYDKKWKRR